jgi:hypothetical protein
MKAAIPITKSTNVRTLSMLAATLAGWCVFVGALAGAGVFLRVGPGASAAALAFAYVYAFALAVLDPEVRDHVARLPLAALLVFALGSDVVIAIIWLGNDDDPLLAARLLAFPYSWIAGTLAPLAAMAHTALLRRPTFLSSAGAKLPDGTPAAT